MSEKPTNFKVNQARLAGLQRLVDGCNSFQDAVISNSQAGADAVHVLTVKMTGGRIHDCVTEERKHHLPKGDAKK